MASIVQKIHPNHDQVGRFSFGSGSGGGKARPVGSGGKINDLSDPHQLGGSDAWTLGGGIVGDLASDVGTRYMLAGMGADLGGLLGPEGRLLGGAAGAVGSWLAPNAVPIIVGIGGSFLGAKIGSALYDL